MKKKALIANICIVMIAILLFSSSFAWLLDPQTSPFSTVTSIQRSYFESGDGTAPPTGWSPAVYDETGSLVSGGGASGPFEIRRPIQLYYLSWLQQLGYFNEADNNGNIRQYYFYLSADLDMAGYALPPIGSADKPFVGNFDGNGCVISNLTVINDTTLSDIPEGGASGDQIVGFFGVVGGRGVTVSGDVATMTVGGQNYTYSSSTNEVKNFGLNHVAVQSKAPAENKTLIGIVAGYVNATVKNVAVCNATVSVGSGISTTDITDNLSDFSLIGFCEEKYKDVLRVEEVNVSGPSFVTTVTSASEGGDNDWGGSIDMLNIYKRIYRVLKGTGTATYTVSDTVIICDANGNEIGRETIDNADGSGLKYYNAEMGNYVGWNRDNVGVDVTTTNNYNLLQGKPFGVFRYTATPAVTDKIFISAGNNYLSGTSSATVTNQTSLLSATEWTFSGGKLSAILNGTTRYLSCSGGTLSLSTSSTTTWTYNASSGTFYCTLSGVTYYLTYNDGWKTVTNANSFLISYNGNYLSVNGTAISSTKTKENAAVWTFSGNNSGYLSTVINGRTYYLNRSNNTVVTLGTSGSSYLWTKNTSNALYYTYRNRKYYLRFSNSWSTSTTSQTLTFTSVETPAPTVSVNSYTVESDIKYDAAYIPLEVINPTSTTANVANYGVCQKNTGYIVGGSQYQGDDRNADIRVSIFTQSYIQTYINSTDKQIYSRSKYNTALAPHSVSTIADDLKLQKFTSSFGDANSGFSKMISQAAYGLHFMDAQIGIDKLTTAEKVIFDRVTMYQYQMPISGIDFALSTNGYINFFAGAYFTNNTSFCSMHQIFRNKDALAKTKDTVLMAYTPRSGNAPTIFKSTTGGYYIYTGGVYKEYTLQDTFDEEYTQRFQYVYMNPADPTAPLYYAEESGDLFTLANGVFTSQTALPDGYEDVNTIKDIKEIDKIFGVYKNDTPVANIDLIYLYSDGTWSDGESRDTGTETFTKNGANYELSFNLDWVRRPEDGMTSSQGNIHYYEIPVNSGEYSLGSVNGEIGAYILYLDLSSNAQKINRTTVTEVVESTTTEYVYPKGVQLVGENGSGIPNAFTGAADSVTLMLPGTFAGASVSFSRNDGTVSHTAPISAGTSATLIGPGLSFTNGDGGAVPIHATKTVVKTETVRQYDYNLATKEETVTAFVTVETTVITADGTVTVVRTAKSVDADGNETEETPDDRVIEIDTVAVSFRTVLPSADAALTVDTSYTFEKDDEAKADPTKPVNMRITLTASESLTVAVLAKNNGCTFKNGETETEGTTVLTINGASFDVGDDITVSASVAP